MLRLRAQIYAIRIVTLQTGVCDEFIDKHISDYIEDIEFLSAILIIKRHAWWSNLLHYANEPLACNVQYFPYGCLICPVLFINHIE